MAAAEVGLLAIVEAKAAEKAAAAEAVAVDSKVAQVAAAMAAAAAAVVKRTLHKSRSFCRHSAGNVHSSIVAGTSSHIRPPSGHDHRWRCTQLEAAKEDVASDCTAAELAVAGEMVVVGPVLAGEVAVVGPDRKFSSTSHIGTGRSDVQSSRDHSVAARPAVHPTDGIGQVGRHPLPGLLAQEMFRN